MTTTTHPFALGAAVALGAALSLGATAAPLAAQHGPPAMFDVAGTCMACHNGIASSTGEDISFGTDWRGSMMANAARDPYWQAAVRREVMEHPESSAAIQDECTKCHMPMARYEAHAAGEPHPAFERMPWRGEEGRMARLAADGVSCAMCHQIEADGLGEEASFTGGFQVDAATPLGSRSVYGPYDVTDGRAHAMSSASLFEPVRSRHIQESALCGSCHTLFTHALGQGGEVVGELPEQAPYLEWLHSDYPGRRSCQSCHMPEVEADAAISSILATDRPEVSRHVFRGGNFFMPRVFNAFRAELAVEALPLELEAVAMRTRENLRTRAAGLLIRDAAVEGGRLAFDLEVSNRTGHKLPTAYPSRRTWLHVTVTDAAGRTVFESGALRPDGSIVGNDNDASADRFEPHHARITSPDQVQIYETIIGDDSGRVTTGLLNGVRFLKDNRIPPTGFDKVSAGADIAVRGDADQDADFLAGVDRVRYHVDAAGAARPLRVTATLWYQPIAFRWASNLRDFDAEETNRFVRYYDALSTVSAEWMAKASRTVE